MENNIAEIRNVSLDVKKGEILAIAGESGCGKSTLAKAIMRLVNIKSGSVSIDGIDSKSKSRDFYKKVQMIFQNPYASLNPKMTIGQILAEPLEINTKLTKAQINKIIEENLQKTGLDCSILRQYPHEFSGGQRQRIAITRSILLNPEFIVADEPVSALDVSIQAQIINLLKELKEKNNLTFLFISHDLSVIKYLADTVAVMYLGEIVEKGTTEEIFSEPKHPYTQALLSAVPDITKSNYSKIKLKGELPSVENLPSGCKFHTRCPYAMEICNSQLPQLKDFSSTHTCRCFLYE